MKPIGALMKEHRLIEEMSELIRKEAKTGREKGWLSAVFVDQTVDFLKTYADRTHHGKEEDIFFRDLTEKKISSEHERIMNELIEEHTRFREKVTSLKELNESYKKGKEKVVDDMLEILEALPEMYAAHIDKEDNNFFYPAQEYFSEEEQDGMLDEFREFDRKMIHEKYQNMVEEIKGRR